MKKNIKHEIFAGRGKKKGNGKKNSKNKKKKVETMGLVIGLFYLVLS